MIKQWDKPSLDMVEKRIEAALQPLAQELGISIKRGGGSYSATNFKMKLMVDVKDASGKVVDRTAQNFKEMASLYGMKETDLGRTVRHAGSEFVLTGLNPRCRKFPFLGKDTNNGKSYKLPLRAVKLALGYKVESWETAE